MSSFQSFVARRAGALGAFAAVLVYVAASAAHAQETSHTLSPEIGRIEFDAPSAAKKSVEVDLGPEMFGALFGIGDGALAGVVDALSDSPQAKEGSKAIQLAAEKATAAREFVDIAKNVVQSVRVRAYDDIENASDDTSNTISHYDQQLKAGGWESAVRARDGDKSVQVSAIRADGAIRGLFIVAAERNKLVLVNVLCNISPENAKRLTNAAVKTGLQSGLDKQIEEAMKHVK